MHLTLILSIFFIACASLPSFAQVEAKCIVTCKGDRSPEKAMFGALSSQKPFPKNSESNINCYNPEWTCIDSEICSNKNQIEWIELVNRTDKTKAPKKLAGTCAKEDKLGNVFRAPMKSGLLWGEGKIIISGKNEVTYFYKAAAGE